MYYEYLLLVLIFSSMFMIFIHNEVNHCAKTPNGIRHQALGEACGYAVTENQCMFLSWFLHAIFGEKHSLTTPKCKFTK